MNTGLFINRVKKNIKLDRFQKEAIELIEKGYSVIVSAPTGAGKTLIAEYILEKCLKEGREVVYTAPIKALSNQKFREFSQNYAEKVGILTGDVSINSSAPILIMTTEIFRNNILTSPQKLEKKEWIIFDEIHYLSDFERGTVWEESIILLPKHMRILALSATIPNIEEFVDWIASIHSHPVRAVIEKKRPVPLHFYFQCNNQIFSSFKKLKKTPIFKKLNGYPIRRNKLSTLINYLRNQNALPCIYFSFSRRRCEDLAQEVFSFDFLNNKEKKEITTFFSQLIEKFRIKSSHLNYLYPLIKRGIAYHHAGLLPTLKEIIERLFSFGLIKLIFTTETFALGINMPARSVIFDTIVKYYRHFPQYLKTRDFYQMAGRAGRRGMDKEGFVFLKINPYKVDLTSIERVIYGEYEPITSQLNSCYATLLNLYQLKKEEALTSIYPSSFHFYQKDPFQRKQTLELLKRKISLLKDMKYIIEEEISWKAELASRVYSFELPIGELYERGILETLEENTLFVLISSLVYEPRKGERKPKLSKRIKRLKKETDRLIKDIHRKERKFRIYPLSKKFYFHISEAACAWMEGVRFYKLDHFCSLDEGEIVRYFRMSIQVLREILTSCAIKEDFRKKVKRCIERVNRDVIDAQAQLRQKI